MKSKAYGFNARPILWVVTAHLAIVLALWIVPWIRRRFRKPAPLIIPIELSMPLAARPSDPAPVADPEPVAPDPEPAPDTTVTTNRPSVDPVSEPEPERVRQRPRIEVSQERVRRDREAPPEPDPVLTAAELRALLDDTLTSETPRTRITPTDEQRALELIRQTLHQAWRQPSGHHLRGRVAVVALRLNAQGVIQEHTIQRSSGDEAMDASVRAAVGAVHRIPGLPPDFATHRPQVTVYFELTD